MTLAAGVEFALLSEAGARAANEDSAVHGWSDDGRFWFAAVADGVGGQAGGDVAAQAATRALAFALGSQPGSLASRLRQGFLAAQVAVLTIAEHHAAEASSTLALAVGSAGCMMLAHAGDSRITHLRGGRVLSRTRDHNEAQLLIEAGALDAASAAGHPAASVLLNSLKPGRSVAEMSAPRLLLPGDVVVLCSDGLSQAVPDTAWGDAAAYPGPLQEFLEKVSSQHAAALHGHSDNYTAILIRIPCDGPLPWQDLARGTGYWGFYRVRRWIELTATALGPAWLAVLLVGLGMLALGPWLLPSMVNWFNRLVGVAWGSPVGAES